MSEALDALKRALEKAVIVPDGFMPSDELWFVNPGRYEIHHFPDGTRKMVETEPPKIAGKIVNIGDED